MLAPDAVVDHVDAAAAVSAFTSSRNGRTPPPSWRVLITWSAPSRHLGELVVGAPRGDHRRAEQLRDLHGGEARRARRAVDEHGLAGLRTGRA
jgi:hypothetical protein